MIYLHTGLPGAGKTILTLKRILDRAKEENRAVYYHGIEILKPEMFPGWVELKDPTKWHELPDGAIFVHDEAQTVYRPRGTGAQVPEHVAKMETHRHQGHDLYFVTQHPMLVDANVRRLAGEHVHAVRPFGAKGATLHKWPQVKEHCDKSRSDSMSEIVAYPAELYGAYKSATIHTHKFKLPGRVWVLLLIPILLSACVWGFVKWFAGRDSVTVAPEKLTAGQNVAAVGSSGQGGGTVKTRAQWMEERIPRVQGLAHTAPAFDKVTSPDRAPYPAACVAMGKSCRCYTDQATILDTPDGLCRQIVDKGFFMEWDKDRGQRAQLAQQEARPDRRRALDGVEDQRSREDAARFALIGDGGTYAGMAPVGR
ncbi:Zonular occludens toxin [Aromatoleum toluvorans]|uniref:Zonular occludens toxin n=1 Tax=Aromatoleum toluvorans TaxID=92002 RepID=A0ABX1Q1G9_9RHOO|nr:Zonular occludens toxin [Aromatoleum toluvorans]